MLIGECTAEQLQILEDDAPSFAALFTRLHVEPTSIEQTFQIMFHEARQLELSHHVSYEPLSFRTVVELGGSLFRGAAFPGKALEQLAFAVDCDPQSALYRAELAYRRDQFESHRYRKQSISELKEAVRIDPRCGEAYYYLGLILGDEKDFEQAEEALRRSIKLMTPDRRPIEALKELSSKKKR